MSSSCFWSQAPMHQCFHPLKYPLIVGKFKYMHKFMLFFCIKSFTWVVLSCFKKLMFLTLHSGLPRVEKLSKGLGNVRNSCLCGYNVWKMSGILVFLIIMSRKCIEFSFFRSGSHTASGLTNQIRLFWERGDILDTASSIFLHEIV